MPATETVVFYVLASAFTAAVFLGHRSVARRTGRTMSLPLLLSAPLTGSTIGFVTGVVVIHGDESGNAWFWYATYSALVALAGTTTGLLASRTPPGAIQG